MTPQASTSAYPYLQDDVSCETDLYGLFDARRGTGCELVNSQEVGRGLSTSHLSVLLPTARVVCSVAVKDYSCFCSKH